MKIKLKIIPLLLILLTNCSILAQSVNKSYLTTTWNEKIGQVKQFPHNTYKETYNNDGKILETTHYMNDKEYGRTIYAYRNGILTSKQQLDMKGELLLRNEYKYDSRSNLKEEAILNYQSNKELRFQYTYKADQLFKKELKVGGIVDEYWIYKKPSSQEDDIQEVAYYKKNELVLKTVTQLDEHKLEVRKIEYYPKKDITKTYEYEYVMNEKSNDWKTKKVKKDGQLLTEYRKQEL